MAEFEDIIVRFGLDGDQFTRGIKQLNRQTKLIESEFRAASAKLGGFGNSTDQLKLKVDTLTRQIDIQRQKVDTHKSAVQDSATKLEKYAQTTAETKAKLDQAKAAYEASAQALGKNAAETQKLENEVKKLEKEYQQSVQAVNNANGSLENNKIKANQAEAALSKLENELRQTSEQVRQQTSVWTRLSETVGAASEKMRSAGEKISSIGGNLTAKVTTPIIGLGTAATATVAKFDDGMSKVQAITGATAEDMGKLRQQAKDLGRDTKFSASQVADAYNYLGMAGWNANKIMEATPALLNLAAAGAMDLGRAADIVSDTMAQFGLEADQAGHAADIFAKAQASANLDVQMLGETMKYAGPVANAFGMSLEEASAVAMIFANNGIKASEAGTAMRAGLTRLAKPPKDAADALAKLNIVTADSKGKMLPMEKIVAQLSEKFKGLSQEQQIAAAKAIFGQEAMAAWITLISAGPQELNKFTVALRESDGAAEEMAKTMENNIGGSFRSLKSAIEGAAISIGERLAPTIRKIADFITELTRKFTQLNPVIQNMVIAFSLIAAAIGPVLFIIGQLVMSVGAIGSAFAAASGAIASAGGIIGVIASPIGIVTAAIASLVAAGVALYKNWEVLNEKYTGLMQALSFTNPLVMLVSSIKKVQNAVSDTLPEVDIFGDKVSESTQKAVGSFLNLNEKVTTTLKQMDWSGQEVTKSMASNISSTFKEMGDQISQGLEQKQKQTLSTMEKMFASSTVLSDQEKVKAIEIAKTSYEERKKAVKDGETQINEIVKRASDNKRQLTEQERNQINQIQQQMVNTGIRVLSEQEKEVAVILERMKQQHGEISAKQASEVVQNSITQKDKAVKVAEERYNEELAAISQMREGVNAITEEQANKLIQEATRQRDEAVKKAQDMHGKVVEQAKQQAGEHVAQVNWETGEILTKWDLFKQLLEEKLNVAKEKIMAVWNGIAPYVSVAFEEIKGAVMPAMQAITVFVNEKLQEIKSFWDQNGTQIVQAATNIWNTIKNVISTVMTALSPIISVAWTGIQMIVQSVWENIKGVISGALNVIQGLIKVFAGVFTGDWSKAWEGIKQATSGAVEFLWNAIQLTLFGKVLGAAKVFITGFKAVFTAGWTAIKSVFTGSISAVQNVVTTGFNAIRSISNAIMNGLRTLISSVWNGIRTTITSAVNTVKTNVTTGFNSLKTSVTTAMNNVKTTITTIWDTIMAFFRGIDLTKVGSDIIGGLIKGIMGKAEELYEKARSIANKIETTIRKALDTNSPSRKMQKVGHDVGDGLARGISQKEKEVKKASEKLAKQAEKAAKDAAAKQKKAFEASMKTADYNFKMGKVDLSGYIKSLENIQKTQAKTTDQVQKVTLAIKKAEADLAKQLDEINKKKFESSKKWIDERKYYNELTLEQELAAWERVAARYKKGTDERIEAEREIYRVKQEINRAGFENSKRWIDEQKYYNKLSLDEELAAWRRVQARYKAGTAERKEADREVYRVQIELLNKAAEDKYKATMDDIERETKAAQEIAQRQKEAIESHRDAALDSLKREEKAEMDSLARRQKAYERDHQARMKMLDDETNAAIKRLQAEIDAIDKQGRDQDNAYKDADRQKELAELRKQYDKYKVSASAKGQKKAADLLKQIEGIETEISRDEQARRLEQQKESLKGQIDNIKEAADKKKEQWQSEFDRQKEWFEQEKEQRQTYYQQREAQLKASFDAELRALEDSTKRQLAQLEQQKFDAEQTRTKMLEDARQKAQENLNVVESGQQQAINVLQNKNQDYYRSGQTLGNMFAYGLESSISRIKEAASKVAKAVSGRLELHSPAKEGPLSTLNTWWNAFSDTILEGLDAQAINAAMNAMVNPNLSFGSLGAVGEKASSFGSGSITIKIDNRGMFDGATFTNMDDIDRRALAMDVGDFTANQVQTRLRAGGRK